MGRHLTPTELARESGLDRRDVIEKCIELGVPIFNGKIDKTLFLSSLQGAQSSAFPPTADHFTLLGEDGNLIASYDDETSAREALTRILDSEPEASGHVALIAHDATGHQVGELSPRPSLREPEAAADSQRSND
jgi:hypothetical protein